MPSDWEELPPMPEIGRPESHYAKQVARADKMGMRHAHEAYKVGQYLTLALAPRLTVEQKMRYFRHALKAHCTGPAVAPNPVMMFYVRLGDLVRHHAGAEALRMASREDDAWANQLARGVSRSQVKADAAEFFRALQCDKPERPDFLNQDDWDQLRILRNQWL